jgi:hypothetical protein
MRVVLAAFALSMSGVALAAQAPVQTVPGSPPASSANCPRTSSYLAEQSGVLRGKPPAPRKLNELPKGTAFMAVFRHINGCEAPLTMVDYRNSRRR